MQDGHKRGLVFVPEKAAHVIDYISRFFVHIKGPLAGQPIILDPWQQFWTAGLYGWYRSDGTRRFQTAYEEVARKNGKSTWKAPQGAYLLMMDGEPGAEVYAVATTRQQAMTVYKPAADNIAKWARRSLRLARSVAIHKGLNQERITVGTSVFAPLPANAENLDGLNPYAILFDELHAQRSPDVWNVMISALGARRSPLLSAITTAGFILDGICTDQRNYLISILEGDSVDDSYFGYIYTLDDGDDPLNESVWIKANPGLGRSKQLEYMRSVARQAARMPSAWVNFLTKDLNVWCSSPGGWFDMAVWNKGGAPFDPEIVEMLRGRRCFAGLDLASVRDLTALVLVFPPDEPGGTWYVLAKFWCPEAKISEAAEKTDLAAYRKWQKMGHLMATPGNVTDYGAVKEGIEWAFSTFDVVSMGYDRWNATSTINELQHLLDRCCEVPQDTGGMYPGAKALELLVYGEQIQHGGHPVLTYCAQNVALLYDTNGNFRPDKKRSNGRIDGIVALVIALARAQAIDKSFVFTADDSVMYA